MKCIIVLWALFVAVHSQAISQIEFTDGEPSLLTAGELENWRWTGGDRVSDIDFTLMQGCDPQHLTSVVEMGKAYATSFIFGWYTSDTLVNGNDYWVQLSQLGSTPVYNGPVRYTGGGEPKSAASSCPVAGTTIGAASSSTATAAVSSPITSSSSSPPTVSSSQTMGSILPSQSATSSTLSTSGPATTTSGVVFGSLNPSAPQKGMSKGTIAGIVIGVLGSICLVGAVIWLVLRQNRRKNRHRGPQGTIENNQLYPPQYTSETPVSPISSPGPSTRRKPVAGNAESLILSDEERALIESRRVEQAEKARKQRASELEEATRRGEEIQGSEFHEVDAGKVGASELEGKV